MIKPIEFEAMPTEQPFLAFKEFIELEMASTFAATSSFTFAFALEPFQQRIGSSVPRQDLDE